MKNLAYFILGVLFFLLLHFVLQVKAETIEIKYTISSPYTTGGGITPTPKTVLKKTYDSSSASSSAVFLPHVSKEERTIINSMPDARQIAQIFLGESTQGKADGCRLKGKFNGFGYRQNTSEWVCFDSFKEVVQHVQNWINDRKKDGFSPAEMTCYYIRGLKTSNCQTAYKFLTEGSVK